METGAGDSDASAIRLKNSTALTCSMTPGHQRIPATALALRITLSRYAIH